MEIYNPWKSIIHEFKESIPFMSGMEVLAQNTLRASSLQTENSTHVMENGDAHGNGIGTLARWRVEHFAALEQPPATD